MNTQTKHNFGGKVSCDFIEGNGEALREISLLSISAAESKKGDGIISAGDSWVSLGQSTALYVDQSAGTDGNGSELFPFQSIGEAYASARTTNAVRGIRGIKFIYVQPGFYTEPLQMEPEVNLISVSKNVDDCVLQGIINAAVEAQTWTSTFRASISGFTIANSFQMNGTSGAYNTVSIDIRNCVFLPGCAFALKSNSTAKIRKCQFSAAMNIDIGADVTCTECVFITSDAKNIFWKIGPGSASDLLLCTFRGPWRFSAPTDEDSGRLFLRYCYFALGCEIDGPMVVDANCAPDAGYTITGSPNLQIQGSESAKGVFYNVVGGFVPDQGATLAALQTPNGGHCNFRISGTINSSASTITISLPKQAHLSNTYALLGTAFFSVSGSGGNLTIGEIASTSDGNSATFSLPTAATQTAIVVTGNFTYSCG